MFNTQLITQFYLFQLCGWSLIAACLQSSVAVAVSPIEIFSPDGSNTIRLHHSPGGHGAVNYSVLRNGNAVIQTSSVGPVLKNGISPSNQSQVIKVESGTDIEEFQFPWGKTSHVNERFAYVVVTLETPQNLIWQIELRAFNDGVAFRYRIPKQSNQEKIFIHDEVTDFHIAREPQAIFNTLPNFRSSHESLYNNQPASKIPHGELIDMPLLMWWPNGTAAAITEARVRGFAGAYLKRSILESLVLNCELSPSVSGQLNPKVVRQTPLESPWRVILLADQPGKLLESNVLMCLNDPARNEDYAWLRPGKTTWHWWYGEFEDDFKLSTDSPTHLERHKRYIDFCAQNQIAYHAVSGDGFAWYQQSRVGYGQPSDDADVITPRPEIHLPEILEYAKRKGVGIRLWVHWKPLSKKLDEAFAMYESWGVKGLMVDFLNRDDQEMIEFIEKLLLKAAEHKLHIQLHGSSKCSGEQRTFPHLLNREGVLNLEFVKWSDLCTPQHNVNVAFTRALTGPVDYHLGGFQSVSRAEFRPRDRAPNVLGTRCHQLALYVVYENPLPMVADRPENYAGQDGFEFVRKVPTTWDETRFVTGEPGQYIVIARRSADSWYLGAISNWSKRRLEIPLNFLAQGTFRAKVFADGSMDEAKPNLVSIREKSVTQSQNLTVSMAPGGGFTMILEPESPQD